MPIKTYTWPDIRNQVTKLNPPLAKAIDAFEPDDSYTFYKFAYPWGDHILHEGKLMIPTGEGTYTRIDDPKLDKRIFNDLSYNITMPLGVVINKALELYYNVGNRVVPFSCMYPGKVFALWVSFENRDKTSHKGKTSNIISGARSVVMGPKISDTRLFKRIAREYRNLRSAPRNLEDHWQVFKHIFDNANENWQSEILLFSRKWTEPRDDIKWKLLRQYFFELQLDSTAYLRDQPIFDLLFSNALEAQNLRPNPYLSDTVKHLYHMSRSVFPGFCVANDDSVIPNDLLTSVFLDEYGLRYAPTLFQMGYLAQEPNVYYSLEYPTLASFSPKSKKYTSKLDDLNEINHIENAIMKFLREDAWEIADSPIYRLLNIDYQYLHPDQGNFDHATNPQMLMEYDPKIKHSVDYYDKPFAESGALLRGSILIRKHKVSC